ncbi:MAG: AI-2E family transporter [Bacteroidales bacterium]|nr:AI-2E family transporter [Bacteroidales bacterium]
MSIRPYMTNTIRWILFTFLLVAAVFGIWFFRNIVIYVLLAFVISMIGEPLVNLISKIRILKKHIPRWIGSLITLILIWTVIFLFFRFFVPLLATEFKYFSNLDLDKIWDSLRQPMLRIEAFINEYNLMGEPFSLEGWAIGQVQGFIGLARVTQFMGHIASTLGNLFVAFFSISFISFFFMKESKLFEDGLVLFFPEDREQGIRNAISSISRLLKRYFIGIVLQTTGIIILDTAGLSVVGLEINHALTIGLIAGVLNVIPYVGPLIGILLGLAIGTAVSMPMELQTELIPRLIFIFIAMEFTQIIDNVVFQPVILGGSVKAHPLEIFIVIMIAASLGGILGMMIAIPSYTVLRVIAREFFSESKLVRKITERI